MVNRRLVKHFQGTQVLSQTQNSIDLVPVLYFEQLFLDFVLL